MAIVQSSPSEDYQGELGPGPGQRLREARNARGLQVEEVAARLRLSIHTIECIEADDYTQLPAPAFVRGYLRGYARLLDLPPGPLVDAYADNEFGAPPLVADISTGSEAASTDFPVRVATYLVVSVLVILVAIWWQSQRPTPQTVSLATDAPAAAGALTGPVASAPEQPASDESAAQPEPRMSAALPPDSIVPEATAQPDEAAQPAAIPLGPVVAAPPGGTDASTSAVSPPDGAVPIEEPPPPGSLASIETARVPEDSGALPEAPAGAVPEASPVPAGPRAKATLRITLSHESWVEVYNRDEKRLYYSLAKAGDTIVISDQPPFRVLLGYTTGVAVEFDGRPFDFSAYRDRGVARFTLGRREGPAAAVADSQADPPRSSQQN